MKTVQFIKQNGQPEWAILPYADYVRLKELSELNSDIIEFQHKLHTQEEELIPKTYANRLIEGENPIRVWREYRGLNQSDLAKKTHITTAYLSLIESDKRQPSTHVVKDIAAALSVAMDDLV